MCICHILKRRTTKYNTGLTHPEVWAWPSSGDGGHSLRGEHLFWPRSFSLSYMYPCTGQTKTLKTSYSLTLGCLPKNNFVDFRNNYRNVYVTILLTLGIVWDCARPQEQLNNLKLIFWKEQATMTITFQTSWNTMMMQYVVLYYMPDE